TLPNVKLIIGEPFAVKNVRHVDDTWFPEFGKYQEVAKAIAKEYKASFIPYQSVFDQAEKRAPGSHWTTDGVHTSVAGINLMALAWLASIKMSSITLLMAKYYISRGCLKSQTSSSLRGNEAI